MSVFNVKSALLLTKYWVLELILIFSLSFIISTDVIASNKDSDQISMFDRLTSLYYRQLKLSTDKYNQYTNTSSVNNNKPISPIVVINKNDSILQSLEDKHQELLTLPSSQVLAIDPNGKRPDKIVNAVITAYTSTPDQTDSTPFIAASGKHVYDGMIAANWLPFGTKIKIPSLYGDKIFTVDDRMNSRYGYGRLDMWLDTSKTEAMKFGVKRVEIYVYMEDTEKPVKLTLAQ